jgi:hypothetical protein
MESIFLCLLVIFYAFITGFFWFQNDQLREQITIRNKIDVQREIRLQFVSAEINDIITDIETEKKENTFIDSKNYLTRLKNIRKATGTAC